MVLAVDGVAPQAGRAMQSFFSEGQWNDEGLVHQHLEKGEKELGGGRGGVFVGYGSSQGYTLLDRRLYVPAEWLTDDAYAERRRQCGMPPETTFKTKPELAQEMITAVVKSQALRCRWVVADEAFGNNPGFLDGVTGLGLWYFAEVPHSTRVWDVRPTTHVPPWRGRGRRAPRARLVSRAPEARTVVGLGGGPRPAGPGAP